MENKIIAPQDKEKLTKIAQQLPCSSGEEGIAMSKLLNETNSGMIIESILSLQLSDKNRILELGHGNCTYLFKILKQALQLRYFGMRENEAIGNIPLQF